MVKVVQLTGSTSVMVRQPWKKCNLFLKKLPFYGFINSGWHMTMPAFDTLEYMKIQGALGGRSPNGQSYLIMDFYDPRARILKNCQLI